MSAMAAPDPVERAARLLALVLERAPRTEHDVRAELDLVEPELGPLLAPLERHGLVRREGGRLRPGPAALRFAHAEIARAELVDELEPGLSVVAAPVFDSGGTVVAALAVSGPTARLPAHRLALLGRVTIEQAHAVSVRLGYRGALEDALAPRAPAGRP